jgi:hypothetical protein
MRTRLGCLFVLLFLVATAAHVWFWYLPRVRAAAPDPGDMPGRLLGSGVYEACFWLPYPHQNLGALGKVLPDEGEFVAAASRLADLTPPELPAFGPFAVPPASEVTVCSDRGGRGFTVAARIYPVLSWIAKAAGKLAGNAWLCGGTIEQDKRTVRVAWQGTLWTVESGETPPLPPPGATPAPPIPEALAAISVKAPTSIFPAGLYGLRQEPGGLSLALAGSPALPDLPAPRPILLAASAPGDKTPAALALFDNVVPGSLQLPGAAAFFPPGGHQRWSLPAQHLMDLVTGRLPRGNAAGWAVVALDAQSLKQAEALAPGLARLVPPAAPGGGGPSLKLGLWIDPPRALDLVGRLKKALEAVPFLDREQVRRWGDAETVLTPLARCSQAGLVSAGSPAAFTLRLSGCT